MLLFCLILCCNEPFSAKSAIAGFAGAQYEENTAFPVWREPDRTLGSIGLISRLPGLIGIISRTLRLIGILLRTLGLIGILSRTLDLIGTLLRTLGLIGFLSRTFWV